MKKVLLFVITLFWNKTFAQPGALDLTFGQGGRVVTDIAQVRNVVSKVLIQPDNKIIAIGYCIPENVGKDFTLVRYLPDGSPDNAFGLNGTVKMPISSVEDQALSAILQTDGKIVVAGYSWNGFNFDFALVRYNPDGNRDPNFGNGGVVLTDFNSGNDKGNQVIIQPDGKIILAGSSGDMDFLNIDVAIARYHTSGMLDESFGLNGKLKINVGNPLFWQSAKAIALQPDGKIVATGFTEALDKEGKYVDVNFLTLRITGNGNLDNTFGDHGIVISPIGKDDSANSISVQPDGKIIILGSSKDVLEGYSDMALIRYNSDGTVDSDFGLNGVVTISFDNTDDSGKALVMQENGQILAVGFTTLNDGQTKDFAMAKMNHDGSLDGGFGIGGKVVTDFGGDLDFAASVLIQKNGKIVVGGHTKIGDDYDFALVRYQNDAALPVRLIAFQVEKLEKSVFLKWETDAEFDSKLFEIQRSTTGKIWEVIGLQTAAGMSDAVRSYEFTDQHPIPGEVYYRLKMIDSDQAYSFSSIKLIKFNTLISEPTLWVYPNPVSERLRIRLPKKDGFQRMELLNVKGSIVMNSAHTLNELDLSNFSPGIYLLQVIYPDHKIIKRIVVDH